MSRFLDTDHPFFAPLWRRVAVVAFCAAWSVFEWATGSPLWGMLIGGLAAWSAWAFLVAFEPAAGDRPE